jgi:hypothetical protein
VIGPLVRRAPPVNVAKPDRKALPVRPVRQDHPDRRAIRASTSIPRRHRHRQRALRRRRDPSLAGVRKRRD